MSVHEEPTMPMTGDSLGGKRSGLISRFRQLTVAVVAWCALSAPAATQANLIISVPKVTAVEAPSQTPLAISISPAPAIPKNAFLRLKGLPPTAAPT